MLELPFVDDPRIEPSLFRYDHDQLHLVHAVENFHWQLLDDDRVDCVLAGWAFVAKIDLVRHDARTSVVLQNLRSGDEQSFASEGPVATAFPAPAEDAWCDYRPGTFGFRFPITEVLASGRPDDD